MVGMHELNVLFVSTCLAERIISKADFL